MLLDLTFMHAKYELAALYAYLMEVKRHNLELQTTLPPELDSVLQFAYDSEDEAEIDIAHQLVNETRDNILPRLYMNTATIAVYSTLEFCISDICNTYHNAHPGQLGFSDLRASDLIDQCKKYFTRIVGLSQFAKPVHIERLQELRLVRNAIVHSSGKMEFLKERHVKPIKRLESLGKGVSWTNSDQSILVSETFLENSFQSVRATVEQLMDDVLPLVRATKP